jgi:hypothetical protein
MDYGIRGVRETDIPFLVNNLRSADIKELIATFGDNDHLGNLRFSVLKSSYSRVGVNDRDEPVVIWGMSPFKKTGIIWASATPEIERYRVPFLKGCRPVIREMFEFQPHTEHLINFTHGNNTLHHRWLKWCHAEVLPEVPFGAKGEPFRPFVIRRGSYIV